MHGEMSVNFKVPLVAVCVVAGLAGCASMNDEQCRRADWYDQGRRDGLGGESDRRIDEHFKACAKAAVVPDAPRWRAGWREGARQYCVPSKAWAEGARNTSYNGTCREFDEANFLRWHRLGVDVYRTRQERDKGRAEITTLEAQLKKAEKEDERKALRDKLRNLDTEQGRLRRLLDTLEAAAPK